MRGVTLRRRLFICTSFVKPSRQAVGEVTCEQALYFGKSKELKSWVSGTRNKTREFAAHFARPSQWRACSQARGEGKGGILGSLYVSGKLPTYHFPKPTLCK